jgi:crotonobetainyl-CoA:carnitine CoA-transferase CaiB-like acyl-CoA transferase
VPALEGFFKRKTTGELCAAFDAAGIPAGPVMNHVDVYEDPQTIARNMVTEVQHTTVGTMKAIGVPVKLSDTPGSVRSGAPLLGEHTDEVIAEWLMPLKE